MSPKIELILVVAKQMEKYLIDTRDNSKYEMKKEEDWLDGDELSWLMLGGRIAKLEKEGSAEICYGVLA